MTLDISLSPRLPLPPNRFGLGLFIPHRRSIAGLTADVTVEETERDDVTVTEHPVEQGAPIADHAFKRPSEVVIRAGWSMQKSGDLSAETGVYGYLLNWQAAFILFDLYTGKRRYQNMLITSLWVTTDQTSEYALMATIVCRQVILTKTQTATTGLSDDPNSMAKPEVNSKASDLGTFTPEIISSPSSPTTDPRAAAVKESGDVTPPPDSP